MAASMGAAQGVYEASRRVVVDRAIGDHATGDHRALASISTSLKREADKVETA